MKVKTLFSTHFHELVELELKRMANFHFKILEQGRKLIFLRELTPGGTDKSYGVHVAEMAGVPPAVIERSFDLVEVYSKLNPFTQINGNTLNTFPSPGKPEERRGKPAAGEGEKTATIQRLKLTIHKLEKELHAKESQIQQTKDSGEITEAQKLRAINHGLKKEIEAYCDQINELEKRNTELLQQSGQSHQETPPVVPRDSKVSLGPTMELSEKNRKKETVDQEKIQLIEKLKQEIEQLKQKIKVLEREKSTQKQSPEEQETPKTPKKSKSKKKKLVQSMLFVPTTQETEKASLIKEELQKVDPEALTPTEAIELMERWKNSLKNE